VSDAPYLEPGNKTAGVLLSGIGGWELGLQRGGWDLAYSAESDMAKREILGRHFTAPVYSDIALIDQPVYNGLCVVGGLPSHECKGPVWDACVETLYRSEARWVVVETVHTLLGHTVWPGAFGRLQRDLHDLGYTTMWFGVAFGNKLPTVRWVRLIILGFPMGWGIPAELSSLHAQVVLFNDLQIAGGAKYMLAHADNDPQGWMECMGYPADWMTTEDDQVGCMSVTSCPQVTEFVGTVIAKADQVLTLTVGDNGAFQLRREGRTYVR